MARFVFGNLVQSTVPVSGGAAEAAGMVAQTGAYRHGVSCVVCDGALLPAELALSPLIREV